AARLGTALVRASGVQRERLLDQYKQGNGPVYSRALALAIPRLQGAFRERGRTVLAERLVRTPEAIATGLRDEDVEGRRAAARACALKQAMNLIPDLIGLLEDSEPAVADAALAALKGMTGQDFGPIAGDDGARTVAAWNEWWNKQGARDE